MWRNADCLAGGMSERTTGSFALLLALLLSIAGCIASTDSDDDEDAAAHDDALSEAGRVEIVQFNPYRGGAYDQYAYAHDQKGSQTYATMEAFASKLVS